MKKLTRNLTGHNYSIYCDNFFTSAALFRDLLTDSVHACGTYNTTRKCYPGDLKDKAIGYKRVNRVQTRWTIVRNTMAGYKSRVRPFHQLSAKFCSDHLSSAEDWN